MQRNELFSLPSTSSLKLLMKAEGLNRRFSYEANDEEIPVTDLTEVTVFLRNAGELTGALGDYGDKVLRVFRDAAAENPGFGFEII